MRINQINSYGIYSRTMYNRENANSPRLNANYNQTKMSQNPSFNGYCGKVAGTLTGIAAAVGLAFVAAPVLACAAPILGAAGLFAGDNAEDKINKAFDNKNE